MVSLKGIIPQWKPLLAWLALLFITNFASARAGITTGQGAAVVFFLVGLLQKIGVIRKIPFLGNLPHIFELGIAFLVNEILLKKTMGFSDIIPAITMTIFGRTSATGSPSGGTTSIVTV